MTKSHFIKLYRSFGERNSNSPDDVFLFFTSLRYDQYDVQWVPITCVISYDNQFVWLKITDRESYETYERKFLYSEIFDKKYDAEKYARKLYHEFFRD